jgi:hypothetical protein
MAKGRRSADDRLLQLLACGATVAAAAAQAGVSEATVYRRLNEPAFRRRLQALRSDMVQRTAGTLTAASAEAVRTLVELLKPAVAPNTRLGAAKAVLESGVKLRELAELEERLAALEEQVQAQQTTK